MKRGKINLKNWIFNIAFVIFNLLVIIYFYKNILLTTVLLLIITIVGLWKWKSKATIAIFFIMGIIGTFFEIIAISFGVWSYNVKNFINIPFWLFILWGNAASFIYQTSLEIKKILKDKI